MPSCASKRLSQIDIADAHVVAGDERLHDGAILIAPPQALGAFDGFLKISAAAVGEYADLGAEPVGLDENGPAGTRAPRRATSSSPLHQQGRRDAQAARGGERKTGEFVLREVLGGRRRAEAREAGEARKCGDAGAAVITNAVAERPDERLSRLRQIGGQPCQPIVELDEIDCHALRPRSRFDIAEKIGKIRRLREIDSDFAGDFRGIAEALKTRAARLRFRK